MSKLLYIQSSPRGTRSASTTVAEHYLKAYQTEHPEATIETLDLWKTSLPEFDGATIDAKYAILHGQSATPEQQAAWQKVVQIAEHFKTADHYLISLPMWNFGIPYKLKHYLDVLLQPGLTFSFTPAEGYKGLVTGKPITVVYARGGAYGPGTGAESYDFQSGYMKQALGFIGFTEIREIFVEPTLARTTSKDEAIAQSNSKAEAFAKTLS
jgi:FMN-dependent NADH-azoreductase